MLLFIHSASPGFIRESGMSETAARQANGCYHPGKRYNNISSRQALSTHHYLECNPHRVSLNFLSDAFGTVIISASRKDRFIVTFEIGAKRQRRQAIFTSVDSCIDAFNVCICTMSLISLNHVELLLPDISIIWNSALES